MALKNNDGNYIKIVGVTPTSGHITYDIYESEDHRNTGDTMFLKKASNSVNLGSDFVDMTADKSNLYPDRGLLDNLKTMAYTSMKGLDDFKDMEDC